MIIDAHTHIFPPEVISKRDNFLDDPGFALLYADKKSRLSGAMNLLSYMDKYCIEGAIAMSFPWRREKDCILHNDHMATVAAEHGGRIFCFGMVPADCGRGEVRRHVHDIKEKGLRGIGELAFYASGFSSGSRRFLRNVLESAGCESLPVCLHVNEPVGHIYPGKYDPRMNELYVILKDFSEVRVILAHWGGGFFMYELMPEVKESLKNVYYDTAAAPYLYNTGIYKTAVLAAGADKIMFGSDYPLLDISRYSEGLSALGHDEQEQLMYRNAAGILKI